MKSFIIISIIFILVNLCNSQTSDVLTLTSENFDQAIQDNSLVLVEFYAPWCGHCKKLAPEYEKAATELKEKGINAKLAQVDADDATNAEIRSRFDLKGFPTIKLFRNGLVSANDYQGERSAEAIFSFMKKQSQPSITILNNFDETTKFQNDDTVTIIGFFDSRDEKGYTQFAETANKLRDSFSFGEVIGQKELAKQFDIAQNTIVLFKKFDNEREIYDSNNEADLTKFIKVNSIPYLDEIGGHNFKNYLEAGLPLAYLFTDLKQAAEGIAQDHENFLHPFRELAKSTRGKLNWVIIDFAKYAKHAERLGLSGLKTPAVAIEKMEEGLHFAYDETLEFLHENVGQWVTKFLNNELSPTIKSEEIPEDNNGPVKIVVAKNFDSIVNDPTKDVLLEFYAPWCGHCKKLAPIYDELGTNLKDTHPNVIIAKVDATANDVPPKFAIKGFPTIKLFTAGNKGTPIDYEGDRSLEDLTKFIQQHTSATGKDEL